MPTHDPLDDGGRRQSRAGGVADAVGEDHAARRRGTECEPREYLCLPRLCNGPELRVGGEKEAFLERGRHELRAPASVWPGRGVGIGDHQQRRRLRRKVGKAHESNDPAGSLGRTHPVRLTPRDLVTERLERRGLSPISKAHESALVAHEALVQVHPPHCVAAARSERRPGHVASRRIAREQWQVDGQGPKPEVGP